VDINIFAKLDFNFDEAPNNDNELELLDITLRENIPKFFFVMSTLLDMDMLTSGDSILYYDEKGHDQLPSIGKEVKPFNDSHYPLIS
jgi:hypothetical protein